VPVERPPSRRDFLKNAALLAGGLGLGVLATQNPHVQQATGEVHQQVREVLEDEEWGEAIKQLRESVVGVYGPEGHGSGFCIADGYLVTCNHVTDKNLYDVETAPVFLPLPFMPVPLPLKAANDPNIEISLPTTDDRKPGKRFRVTFAHKEDGTRAQHKDISLLQLPVGMKMKPIPWGTAAVGEKVITIGDPLDATSLVGTGRVSKEVILAHGEEIWEDVPLIGTDAPINPGNSGGLMASFRRENGKVQSRAVGMSAYGYNGRQGMSGGLRMDYICFIATTQWNLPLMTPEQVEQYKKDFPDVK
jgi:S1-C subfamily serine protease